MPNHRKYQKIDPVELHRLYWIEWKPTTEIARMFGIPARSLNEQMESCGIRRRRHTQRRICKVAGCGNPVFYVEHKLCRSGSYGTMCKEHRRQHYSMLSRARQRRIKGIIPENFKWWQFKYEEQEKVNQWKQLRKAKQSLKYVRKQLKQLAVGLPPIEG